MDGRLFWGLFCLVMLPDLASADSVNSEWYSTTRALSMGNVGIASGDDPVYSGYYNPAALSRSKKPSIEIFNPQFDIGSGTLALSKDIFEARKQTGFSAMKPLLLDNPGKVSSQAFSFGPSLSSENFNFGILYSVKSFSYYSEKDDAYYHHSRRLLISSFGMAMGFLGGRVRFGLAARGIQNYENNIVAKGSDASTVTDVNNARAGFGLGVDSGFLVTLPWSMLPTIGGVARNIGGTSYPSKIIVAVGPGTANLHEISKMTYDGGFSISPKTGKRDQMTLAFDYRDILNVTQTSELRHFNAGFEMGFRKLIFIRGGYSQGYWTAGIGLSAKSGSFDLGSYGEELDSAAFNSIEDRRYSLRFTRRF